MTRDDERLRYLQVAIDEAIAGAEAYEGGPFGAVIVREGRVIARAHNRVTATPDATAHAEVEAIRQACRALGVHALVGCELFASCEPCPMCLSATYWARVDRVYYAATRIDAAAAGFDDALMHEALVRPDGQRLVESVHVTGLDAAAPFAAWARLEGTTSY